MKRPKRASRNQGNLRSRSLSLVVRDSAAASSEAWGCAHTAGAVNSSRAMARVRGFIARILPAIDANGGTDVGGPPRIAGPDQPCSASASMSNQTLRGFWAALGWGGLMLAAVGCEG